MKDLINNANDLKEFIKMLESNILKTTEYNKQLQEELKKTEETINMQTSKMEALKNWLDILENGDLGLVKIAYDELMKNRKLEEK